MRQFLIPVVIFLLGGASGYVLPNIISPLFSPPPSMLSPIGPTPKPLTKYTFTALETYVPKPSRITMSGTMFTEDTLTAYVAHYTTTDKNMSLQIMVPNQATPSAGFPVILMIRGFVDAATYKTGIGTKNAARYFAAHGFVTVAPDFLGYGDSDPPPSDTMEARLEKPAQLLDLMASLNTLPFVDTTRLGIWGHSNGGQIALSLLEITGKPIPAVLWAPVSKPFPYSMLYYTDEYTDGGKALRKTLADFEQNYDVFDYSLDKFIDRLAGPIQLHQGGNDTAVPQAWSDAFVKTVNQAGPKIEYFIYPAADHNLQPDWNLAVSRSLQFFINHLE